MARSPSGVAIGVSGAAHLVQGSPTSHVPAAVGSWHCVNPLPSFTVQQSWPGEQHTSAQQNPPEHAPASIPHGGIAHMPLLQNGSGPGPTHDRPHAPQLLMSFASLTHVPPQQLSRQPHSASVVQPPPVPDDETLDDVVVVELLEDVVRVAVVDDVPP
jgi:hypothetical protein